MKGWKYDAHIKVRPMQWTKNGKTWQACQRSKVVHRGTKGTKMVNLSLFEHLGPFWAHLKIPNIVSISYRMKKNVLLKGGCNCY